MHGLSDRSQKNSSHFSNRTEYSSLEREFNETQAELIIRDTTSLISEIEEIDAETEVNEDSEVNEKEDPLADFTALLTREIALLNGSVVPKLNWSTPKVCSVSAWNPDSLGCSMDYSNKYTEMSNPTRYLPPP